MDVCIVQPVFVDGALFAWVANAAHQYDLGGIVPGGWPQNAVDVYSDPVIFKPFKLVERGVIRRDLEEMYRRQSRMPDLVALDLRAQLAGCRFATRSLLSTCEEFGAGTVKAAMRRILDRAQEAFASKLSRIPDGTWSDVRYFDEKLPGDRHTHRIQVNVEKRGDRLVVDNLGTDPQTDGPLGFPYIGFAGGFMGILSVMMLHEHTFAIGGAERQVDFRPLPGLLTCVDYPAAVAGSVMNLCSYMQAVMNIVSRMLACDPELCRDVIAGGGDIPMLVVAGTNDRGAAFGTGIGDGAAQGTGARSHRDGVATGGYAHAPMMRVPDVEATEVFYPFLMIYRQEREDSAGAGRWSGGVGVEYALTPYRAGPVEVITNCGGSAVSTASGTSLFGAYPVPPARYEILKDSDLLEWFAARRIPRTDADLVAGGRQRLRGKSNGAPIATGDLLVVAAPGGGGYGDPLDREPEHVAADHAAGHLSAPAAESVHGVVLAEDGSADGERTEALRARLRAQRAAWRPAREWLSAGDDGTTPATGQPARPVHPMVVTRDEGDQRVLACHRCDQVLADHGADYRVGLLADAAPLTVVPSTMDPSFFLDDEMVLWRFCCPSCHTLMSTQINRVGDVLPTEMRLA
jgi:N-methylhydantoinase B